ncbi:MAG: hypothetical protein A2168_09125 [Planctomycetes bacterium RBG_13_50_24]|nr:MAG: hypothetical protein A2168_09125 [Planctomycetes bacterium RBG_13_50_24]
MFFSTFNIKCFRTQNDSKNAVISIDNDPKKNICRSQKSADNPDESTDNAEKSKEMYYFLEFHVNF